MKVVNVRGGRPHTRKIETKSAARAMRRPATLSGPVAEESVHIGDSLFTGLCMIGAAACNFALQVGTMAGMFPGMGWVAAGGLILAEMGAGHGIGIAKDRSTRRMLLAVLLLFGVLEAGLPLIREVQVHQQAAREAAHDTAPAMEPCVPQSAPKEYGTQRLPIWQAGERQRMADCRAAQVSERHEHQDKLEAVANERSWWETPIRMALGLGLSLAIGGMARALRGK